LVCLENTHNVCNGSPIPAETIAEVADLAHAHGLRVHVDGARLFNAAAALGVPASELVAPVDSVTFCLSKGLSAPVGAIICGSRAFIAEVHRARKILGGGMRQAGVLAAAGIVALDQMVDRLAEDHVRARRLAAGFAEIPGLEVGPVHTNIFYFSLSASCPFTGAEVADGLKARGVLLPNRTARRFRAVTHCWIDDAAIDKALNAMREVMADAG
jgi:threonine aldolase